MNPSSAFLRRATSVVAPMLVAVSTSQAAVPPAPPGWTAAASGDVEIYQFNREGHRAELRLFPVEAPPAGFDDWFAARIARPMQGVMAQKFVAKAPPPSATFHVAMAAGRDGDGGRLGLVRLACLRADRGAVFAELVLPDDEATGRPAFEAALAMVKGQCQDAAASGASTAAATASAPVAKQPPKRDYAFMTAKPGTGIKASQVEAVLYRWTDDQAGFTMQVHTYFYLLLKDGSFRDGLPAAALSDIDLEAAKKGEPKIWGRWTREGDQYDLTWPDKSGRLLGKNGLREPARPGETLDGVYKGFSAYSTGYSVSSSEWSIQFSRDGHFTKSANRSVVGSAGMGARAVGGAVISDDSGTTSTMGGSNFATARGRPNPTPAASRTGTYKLDGYNIELDYDNGVVERRMFCTTADRQSIWFEGDEIDRPRPRK